MPKESEEIQRLREIIEELGDQYEGLHDVLEYKLQREQDTSPNCIDILDNPPECSDFIGTRRFAACKAWQIMNAEGIPWKDAIGRGWDEGQGKCGVTEGED